MIAVGPGGRDDVRQDHPTGPEHRRPVLFGKWSGTEVTLDGEELLIMKECDIMGVVA